MRGADVIQKSLFSIIRMEDFILTNPSLRAVCELLDGGFRHRSGDKGFKQTARACGASRNHVRPLLARRKRRRS